MLLAVALCVGAVAVAFADGTITWNDVESGITKNGWEGEFKTFDEIAVQIWIPNILLECALTEEDTAAGYIGYYMTEDESSAVAVMYIGADGMTLEDYAAMLPNYGATEVEMSIVNDLPCVTYVLAEDDVCCISFIPQAGCILEVVSYPYSDADFRAVASTIFNSVRISNQEIDPGVKFTLPVGIKVIESEAFAGIGAKFIHLPNNLTEIAPDAFDSDVILIVDKVAPVMTACDTTQSTD